MKNHCQHYNENTGPHQHLQQEDPQIRRADEIFNEQLRRRTNQQPVEEDILQRR